MKKKKLESVTVSKEFLEELLTPFLNIGKIENMVCGREPGKVIIFYRKEVTEHTS